MKFIVILLVLSTLVSAKTWLKIVKESDFKQYLRKSQPGLDAPVIFFPENFRHQITMKELLCFPVDPTAARKRLLQNLDTTYTRVKSGNSLTVHPAVKQPKKN
jgi:hypothetical protein